MFTLRSFISPLSKSLAIMDKDKALDSCEVLVTKLYPKNTRNKDIEHYCIFVRIERKKVGEMEVKDVEKANIFVHCWRIMWTDVKAIFKLV